MPHTPSAETGANVRAEMARRGVSQTDLSARLGMNQSQISKRLSGTIAFTIDELVAIATTLGVPLTALLPADVAAAAS